MARIAVVCSVLLIVVAGGVWAEQIGGPSGPQQGELRLGAEANFRDDVEGLAVVSTMGLPLYGQRMRLSTHTFYGAIQYGLTDRLSVRGKAGMGKVGIDAIRTGAFVPGDLYDFGYGLAWSAGLQYRICAPAKPGTSFAISGQFAHMEPDDVSVGLGGPVGWDLTDGELDEITAALTVGTTMGKTRPYAGIVWSDLDFDFADTMYLADQIMYQSRRSFEKDDEIGAVFGFDQDFCDRGWLNLEARVWDEASFAATVGLSW